MIYGYWVLGLLFGLGVSSLSVATIPVIDYMSIGKEAQELNQLGQEYQALEEQLSVAEGIYNNGVSELKAITGSDDFGVWENDQSALETRTWSPGDWASALSSAAGGNSGRFQELLKAYQDAHPGMNWTSVSDYSNGASPTKTAIFKENLSENQVSQSLASGAYADVNQNFQTLQKLGSQIGQDPNGDLKQAVDLNSRIQLEVANLSNEQLRMQALINEQEAQQQSKNLEEENDGAQFLARGVSQAS